MNSSRNLLLILALCMLSSLSAKKRGGGAPRATEQPQPRPTARINQPVQTQPIQRKESYRDLVTFVKNAHAWDNSRSMLRTDFVNTVVQKAQAANLDGFQLEALLQTARDLHGIFSGNQNKDIATLQSVNNQIAAAIR
jgi:hypothetical protein